MSIHRPAEAQRAQALRELDANAAAVGILVRAGGMTQEQALETVIGRLSAASGYPGMWASSGSSDHFGFHSGTLRPNFSQSSLTSAANAARTSSLSRSLSCSCL
jgi:hypothetical protein